MDKEEKEAIKFLQEFKPKNFWENPIKVGNQYEMEDDIFLKSKIDTVLNYVIKLEKENEEKDKQINLIITKINQNFNSIFFKYEIDEIKNIYNKIKNTSELTGLDLRKECIKVYFKNLLKGEN